MEKFDPKRLEKKQKYTYTIFIYYITFFVDEVIVILYYISNSLFHS